MSSGFPKENEIKNINFILNITVRQVGLNSLKIQRGVKELPTLFGH